MKLINKAFISIFSGALILLGFGSCKSSKRARQLAEEQAQEQAERERLREMERQDSIRRAEEMRERIRRDNDEPIRVLYGPPPSRYIRDIDK